jgi:hypothetical protein
MIVIILMGWLYVIMLLALTQASVAAGVSLALFLGVCPVILMGWVLRRRRRMRLEHEETERDA